MKVVVAPQEIADFLREVQGSVEIQTEGGKVLGRFEAVVDQKAMLARVARQVTPEELDRIYEREKGQGITTEELLKKLHALEPAK